MTPSATDKTGLGYGLAIEPLQGTVTAWHGDTLLAQSERAKVMFETRLPPAIYFPPEDIRVPLGTPTDLQTFCPFKGTAHYHDLILPDQTLPNAIWSYAAALPESRGIEGHLAFMPAAEARVDLGTNTLTNPDWGNISGPMVDWLLRRAGYITSPKDLTAAYARELINNGVALSRLSVMIWSLHPMIAGKNYIWEKSTDKVTTYAPTYEIHNSPAFRNSPLQHVSNGLGGIRQKLGEDYADNSFPIVEDLKAKGATDYVAMPLPFSDGQMNVMTITSDHPDGFSTPNLGLIFECVFAISRFFEVFNQRENAQALLETYVGKRSGARVLGGDIRRGEGDEIDAAILFCDLRGSTRLEQELDRAGYITLLNHFFETTSNIIDDNGGEVLKFIGDAVLAVFPAGADKNAACARALASARAIVQALATGQGPLACDCAIGIEFGRVTYGNVGSQRRLDFTVIGQAANVAARLCDHAKTVDQTILASANVAALDSHTVDVGDIVLRNVSDPIRCLGVKLTPTATPA